MSADVDRSALTQKQALVAEVSLALVAMVR